MTEPVCHVPDWPVCLRASVLSTSRGKFSDRAAPDTGSACLPGTCRPGRGGAYTKTWRYLLNHRVFYLTCLSLCLSNTVAQDFTATLPTDTLQSPSKVLFYKELCLMIWSSIPCAPEGDKNSESLVYVKSDSKQKRWCR